MALVTFFVAMALVSVFFAMTFVAFFVVMLVAVTFPVAAAFLWKIFAVETLLELLLRSFAHRDYGSLEKQGLSCHYMVEVHGDLIFSDSDYCSNLHMSSAVVHRNLTPYREQVLAYLAVDLEGVLREFLHFCKVIFSITLLRSYRKGELLSRLEAFNFCLKLRDKHIRALDIVQRVLPGSSVYKLSFHFEVIADLYYCVLSNLHYIFFKYFLAAEIDIPEY